MGHDQGGQRGGRDNGNERRCDKPGKVIGVFGMSVRTDEREIKYRFGKYWLGWFFEMKSIELEISFISHFSSQKTSPPMAKSTTSSSSGTAKPTPPEVSASSPTKPWKPPAKPLKT